MFYKDFFGLQFDAHRPFFARWSVPQLEAIETDAPFPDHRLYPVLVGRTASARGSRDGRGSLPPRHHG
jgi:hypothetical protein